MQKELIWAAENHQWGGKLGENVWHNLHTPHTAPSNYQDK